MSSLLDYFSSGGNLLTMITPEQIRAARAMLDWTQGELAERAGISKTGLNNIERGASDPKSSTMAAIQRVLEEAGIQFTNGGEPGIKLKRQVASVGGTDGGG